MNFDCSVSGCGKLAKTNCNGMCLDHALEAARKHNGIPKADPDLSRECRRCGRMARDVTGFDAEKKLCATCGRKQQEETMETKFCPACGKSRIKKLFAGTCMKCFRAGRGSPRKKDSVGVDKKPIAQRGHAEGCAMGVPMPQAYTLIIDFTPYPALHARLTAIAKAEMRPPEMQLLYLLSQEFGRMEEALDDEKGDGR